MTIRPWNNFKIEGEKIIFTIPEPKEKFNKGFLKLGIEAESDEYRSWKLANEHFIRLNSISKKKREEIFNKFKKGGINIGEIAKLFKVSVDLVSDILCFNIEKVSILRRESI